MEPDPQRPANDRTAAFPPDAAPVFPADCAADCAEPATRSIAGRRTAAPSIGMRARAEDRTRPDAPVRSDASVRLSATRRLSGTRRLSATRWLSGTRRVSGTRRRSAPCPVAAGIRRGDVNGGEDLSGERVGVVDARPCGGAWRNGMDVSFWGSPADCGPTARPAGGRATESRSSASSRSRCSSAERPACESGRSVAISSSSSSGLAVTGSVGTGLGPVSAYQGFGGKQAVTGHRAQKRKISPVRAWWAR